MSNNINKFIYNVNKKKEIANQSIIGSNNSFGFLV